MKKGFFLVEIMVSLSIFTLVAVSTTGALLALIDANIKAQGLKSVMDNLNVAVENMSRTIRFGTGYACDGSTLAGGECDNDGILFKDQAGVDIKYYLIITDNKGTIYRSIGGADSVAMTAPEVNITSLKFYIYGAGTGDGQPRVLIVINGRAGLVTSAQSFFNLQTTVSQRLLDSD